MKTANIGETWNEALRADMEQPYFADILSFIDKERHAGKEIYPSDEEMFSAFLLCPFENIKVVIIGQDPYHGTGQAHGLSFSVKKGVKLPPSLKNIYKELKDDLGIEPPLHGYLEAWARQGVLMLNASLSVEKGLANSHSKIGWEHFTDNVIKTISEKREGVVFLLWGKFAQQKEALIDETKHIVLKSAHPSPFSAHTGFLGSKPFSRINALLEAQGKTAINWQLD